MTTRQFVIKHLEPLMEQWTHKATRSGYLPLDEVVALIDRHFTPRDAMTEPEKCYAIMDIIIDGTIRGCNKPKDHKGLHEWSLEREA